MSTKKNTKKAVKAEVKKAEVKKAEVKKAETKNTEVKKAEPKWGTAEWAYAHPWSEMDRKRKGRVAALGVFSDATKVFIDSLDIVRGFTESVPVPGDGCHVCDATRQLAIAAHHDLASAVYNLSYVVDVMVVADLLAAWTKKAE